MKQTWILGKLLTCPANKCSILNIVTIIWKMTPYPFNVKTKLTQKFKYFGKRIPRKKRKWFSLVVGGGREGEISIWYIMRFKNPVPTLSSPGTFSISTLFQRIPFLSFCHINYNPSFIPLETRHRPSVPEAPTLSIPAWLILPSLSAIVTDYEVRIWLS